MLAAQQTREAREVDRACLAETKPQSREFAKGWLANDRRREQQKQQVIEVADTGERLAKNILAVFHNREQPQKRRKSPESTITTAVAGAMTAKLTAAVEQQVAEASAPPSVSNKGRQESRSRGRAAKAQSQQLSSNDSSGGVVRRL